MAEKRHVIISRQAEVEEVRGRPISFKAQSEAVLAQVEVFPPETFTAETVASVQLTVA